MRVKRAVFTVVAASMLLLATGISTTMGNPANALPGASLERAGITIPYAGRLSDSAGLSVADGAYDLSFTLYGAAVDGDPLWAEVQQGVAVAGGEFLTSLGSVEPIPTALSGQDLWLAVSVRGPGEAEFTALAPRQQVGAATPNAGAPCAHDHFGESWTGDSGTLNDGLRVENTRADSIGVTGVAHTGVNATGVFGWTTQGVGVQGSSDSSTGVRGTSNSGVGVSGVSSNRGVYGLGADGVVGESSTSTKSGVYGLHTATGYGVTGRGESHFGVLAWGNNSSLYDEQGDLLLAGSYGEIFSYGDWLNLYSNQHVIVDLDNDNNSAGSFFRILGGNDEILWTISEARGAILSAGFQATSVQTADYGQRLLYAVEGTEVWVEDMGMARLVGGEVTVAYDPVYLQMTNLQQDYRVFVTALSDQPVLLYVSAKTASGFTVRGVTLDGRPADCPFDYRVVAQRAGYEGNRLTEMAPIINPKVNP